MDKTTTLEKLALFTQNEKQLLADMGFGIKEKAEEPKQSAINSILNYSKALSIRPSKITGHIEMLLN
jgi:hypothetical protein